MQQAIKSDAQTRTDAAKRFLRTLAGNSVNILFKDEPKTDGKTVWLGDLDPESPSFETYALGHGIHELMHVNETDMAVFGQKKLSPFARSLLNIFEDIRIDALGISYYAGYSLWRNDLMEKLQSENRLAFARSPSTLEDDRLLLTWIHAKLLTKIGFTIAAYYEAGLRNRLLALTQEPMINEIEKVLADGDRLENTAAALAKVRIIEKLLKREMKVNLKKSETIDLFSDFERNTGNFLKSILESGTALNFTQDEVPLETEKTNDDSFTLTAEETPNEKPEKRSSVSVGTWPDVAPSSEMKRDMEEFSDAFQKEQVHLNTLTERFKELLALPADDEPRSGETGLNLTELWIESLATKSTKLFEKTGVRYRPDADLVLLLDRSGSMGIEKMTKAKVAVAAFLSALAAIADVKTHFAVFPGLSRQHVMTVMETEKAIEQIRKRIAPINAFGATPIVEALTWAEDELKSSLASERLIVILTDGILNVERTKPVVQTIESAGIEIALMNIDTENPNIVTNTVTVEDFDEIDAGLIQLIKNTNTYKERNLN